MKKFNYILLALVSATSLAFTACEDKAEYTPAGADTASGVYFSTEAPSTVNLDKGATSFDVEIYRGDDSADQSVELTVLVDDANAGKLTIPTVANFAKGSKVANITIGYDPTTLEYEDWIDVILVVKDESLRSIYAEYTYSFSAGIPAPYTKVVAANGDETATYREDLVTTFFGVENLVYDLELRENDITPGIYRLINPYGEAYEYNAPGEWDDSKDYYIEIDATDPDAVVLNQSWLGCDWGYGEFGTWSLAGYYMARQGATKEQMKEAGYTGTLVDGIITFPAKTLLFCMAGYNNAGLYTSNVNGLFAIALPGYELTDYSVDVTYMGRLTAPDEENHFAIADVNIGEDVETARVAMVKTDDVNAAIAAILEGTVETTEVTQENQDENLQFRLDGDGNYVIAAITYVGSDAKEAGYATFTYTSVAPSWESLGTGLYTDDFMTTIYNVSPQTYEVEIEENTETPGLYRLVNPYGAAYPYNAEGDWDASKNYYMEINACDPAGVYIPYQGMGLNWGQGELFVYSFAANYLDNGYDFETVKGAGYCGTLVDGVITFATQHLLVAIPDYSNSLYYANTNGAFQVVLPEAYATMSTMDIMSRTANNAVAHRLTEGTPMSLRESIIRIPNATGSFLPMF